MDNQFHCTLKKQLYSWCCRNILNSLLLRVIPLNDNFVVTSKFRCTKSRHKPHLHTGHFTVKGGVRGFVSRAFWYYIIQKSNLSPLLDHEVILQLRGLHLSPVAIFFTDFTCQIQVWPKNSSSVAVNMTG